jgi:hypothetical protein
MTSHNLRIEGQADGSWVVRDTQANIILAKFDASSWASAYSYVRALES